MPKSQSQDAPWDRHGTLDLTTLLTGTERCQKESFPRSRNNKLYLYKTFQVILVMIAPHLPVTSLPALPFYSSKSWKPLGSSGATESQSLGIYLSQMSWRRHDSLWRTSFFWFCVFVWPYSLIKKDHLPTEWVKSQSVETHSHMSESKPDRLYCLKSYCIAEYKKSD